MATRKKVRYAKEQFKKSRYYLALRQCEGPGRIIGIGISRTNLNVGDAAPTEKADDFCLVVLVQGTLEAAAHLGRAIIPDSYHGVRIVIRWGSQPPIARTDLPDK